MNFKDPKDPAESVVLEFDFSGELDAITGASVVVSVAAGIDPLAADVLDGAHQIAGRSVLQRFHGGVSGARYKFRAVATDGEDTIVRAGIAAVRTA